MLVVVVVGTKVSRASLLLVTTDKTGYEGYGGGNSSGIVFQEG